MMIRKPFHLIFLQLSVMLLAFMSSYSQTETDSIIFRAMKDEIDRSMADLTYKDYARPCYIGFQYSRENSLMISAELGALMLIDSARNTGWSYRYIVGNYEINDENFRRQNQNMRNDFSQSLQLFPLTIDYYGIRRAFWLAANDIYLRAGSNYREKSKLIENGKISREMLSLPDFSPSPRVGLFIGRNDSAISLDKLTSLVTGLSEAFYHYPSITWSGADLVIYRNDIYFQSSEGTQFSIPFDISAVSVSILKENKDNEKISRSMVAYSEDPFSIPAREDLNYDLGLFAGIMDSLVLDRTLDDDYQGPVLFTGTITTEMLLRNLFGNSHSLVAERNDLVLDQNGDIYFENLNNKWQEMVGKRILPEGLNIIDTPSLTDYNGTRLLGHFMIDRDGVVPPDTLVLVENGIVKSMIGSRTPTSVTTGSNGHGRFYFSYGGSVTYSFGPAVLQISSASNHDYENMKTKLLAFAREESLDYAIIIKTPAGKVSLMPFLVYKVDVMTGKEEVVNNVSYDDFIDLADMRKLIFGGDGFLYNSLWNSYNNSEYINPEHMGSGSVSGYPVSVIGPEFMLVKDMKINTEKQEDRLHSAGDEISNPLKRN